MGSSIKIIDTRELINFQLPFTENITKSLQLDFLKTNIQAHPNYSDAYKYFHYVKIENQNRYTIILLEEKPDIKTTIEPYVFGQCYKYEDIKGVDVFVTSNYFTIYLNGKFMCLKVIEESNEEDIKLFIYQMYDLKVDKLHFIDDKKLEELKTTFNEDSHKELKTIPIVDSNSFDIFLFFILLLIFLSSIFLYIGYDQYQESKKQEIVKTIKKEKKIVRHKEDVSSSMVKIFKFIKINNLKLLSIEYEKNRFHLKLESLKEKNLFDFVNVYFKKSQIKTIKKDIQTKNFIMEVVIYD